METRSYCLWMTHLERALTDFEGKVILMEKSHWFRWMETFARAKEHGEITKALIMNEWQLRRYTGDPDYTVHYQDEFKA